MRNYDITIAHHRGVAPGALLFVLLAAAALPACSDEASGSPWTKFVQVAGQPDPVPEQWVSTPEGKFSHSIVIPNPVPKDSGYRPGMSSKEYFEHLCKTEAGEFIFKKVEGVKGFYFMRPPTRPTDDDLKDRYKLEAPDIERTFQLVGKGPKERAKIFVAPPFNLFSFVEEPGEHSPDKSTNYVRSWGYWAGRAPMQSDVVDTLESNYGVTWRGIRRGRDREHAFAGSEWIVLDLRTREVLAVMRNFGLTGRTRGTKEGIWWLNALSCPVFAARYKYATSERIYNFVSATLGPLAQQNRR
jgi:hypothetical protein